MLCYRINVTADDNDTFLVTCPAFPELTTFGETEAEGALHGIGAVEEAIAARISGAREVPEPEQSHDIPAGVLIVPLPMMTALKIALYRAMREDQLTRAELSRRLGWKREQVDRLFRLDHASRSDQIEAAFNALSRAVDFRIEPRDRVA